MATTEDEGFRVSDDGLVNDTGWTRHLAAEAAACAAAPATPRTPSAPAPDEREVRGPDPYEDDTVWPKVGQVWYVIGEHRSVRFVTARSGVKGGTIHWVSKHRTSPLPVFGTAPLKNWMRENEFVHDDMDDWYAELLEKHGVIPSAAAAEAEAKDDETTNENNENKEI
ncbi:hypothetical protein [Brachybacterium sp. NPDC056505]|jgi:hypothetical protein|uniref:hypothetical protein n=1 Tax=Brachybacterium sp. NPDC056505 TaxID=3345843 RepID=UPI00366EB24C